MVNFLLFVNFVGKKTTMRITIAWKYFTYIYAISTTRTKYLRKSLISMWNSDQFYSSTWVPTSQHESTQVRQKSTHINTSPTWVNTNHHEFNTSQHESNTSQHKSNTSSTRVNTSPTRVRMSPTWINTNQHQSDTSQHESSRVS